MKASPGALIERESELLAAGAMLDDIVAGEGGAASVEGPAGIGKSSLLGEIRAEAKRRGITVQSGRGSELETEFGFGVVRQLLEAATTSDPELAFAAAAAPARELFAATARPDEAEPAGNVSFSILHGLYWTVLNLAGEEPLLLVVDDLHWCDRPSLRFLAYLIHRLEGTRVGVVTARRSNEQGVDPALMSNVTTVPGTIVLSPSPLTAAGVGQLVERHLDQEPDQAFAIACERASGGNPLLLEQTVRALARENRRPTAGDVEAIADLGPGAVSRAIAARMSGLPRSAETAARAIATLGEGSDITEVVALTGLGESEVAEATAALTRAGILEQDAALSFTHPLVRAAIVESASGGERQLAHTRAAKLLHERGASPERIAAQLLAAPHLGDPWAGEVLDQATKVASASGAIDSAVTYMTRRLQEPIEEADLPQLLLQLGMAEAGTGVGTAVEHLERAYETLPMPEFRVIAAYALGRVLLFRDQAARCAALAAAARAELASQVPLLVPIVESVELISIYFGADVPRAAMRFEGLRQLPEDPTPGDCVLAAAASYDWLYRGGSAEECAELATRSIDLATQMEVDTGLTWIVANVVLVAAERPEAMERWDQALKRSHAQGSMFGVMSVHLWRGFTELHQGELSDAESSLRAGVEQITLLGGGGTLGYAYGLLASTLLAQGRLDEAEQALWLIGERPAGTSDSALLWRVGEIELMLARGRNEEALEAARRHVADCGWRVNPAFTPGRRLQAEALLALGRREEAEAVMVEELELAEQWGAPGTVGSTLARLALTRASDDRALAELQRAVALLEASPRRLELAQALASLGAALRRTRKPSQAREPLRRAYELAEACGAAELVAGIRTELHASGARPRTSALSGPASLTASERRVADLASAGRTNKEIAQALFVTPKTVEVHLSNTYRKLDISGRRELPGALSDT